MRIFLTGFMGAGKSYWGRQWADKTGMQFYDLDEVLEQEEQLSIPVIFETKGESYFRNRETAFLHRLIDVEDCIVSCGGGTPCYNDNMTWMNENGTSVFLSATPEQLVSNILKDKDKRPLLKNVSAEALLDFTRKKLAEREPYYSAARLSFPVTTLSASTINTIIQHSS